jgi:hypothetical protein
VHAATHWDADLMIKTEIDSAEAARTPPPQQVLVQISQGMWLAQTVATGS